MYNLHELSFREYLNLTTNSNFNKLDLTDLLDNHNTITPSIVGDKSIIGPFKEYLESGVYPFFREAKGLYHNRLVSTINVIIESDLPSIANVNFYTTHKLRKLISLIADSVPFKVNISELSRKSEISRDVLLRMLSLLDRDKTKRISNRSFYKTR